jgi:DUF1365 family protein
MVGSGAPLHPRVLGCTFKPVSSGTFATATGAPRFIVVEVNNTFSGRHSAGHAALTAN